MVKFQKLQITKSRSSCWAEMFLRLCPYVQMCADVCELHPATHTVVYADPQSKDQASGSGQRVCACLCVCVCVCVC